MRKKTKVCILTTVHHLYDIRIFFKQAKSLAAAGYDVTLVVPDDSSGVSEVDGITVIPLRKPKNRLDRVVRLMWRIWRIAARQKADVYHFHDPELLFVGLLLKVRRAHVVYDIHENVAKSIRYKRWVPLRNTVSRLYRLLEIGLCRFFPLILAEASYDELYPNRFRKVIVQNFPSLAIFPDTREEKCTGHLVYLGGITRMRGLNVVLEALSHLKQQNVPFRFHCIGSADVLYENELEELANRLGISEAVTFYGEMKATDAYEIVTRAEVGLAVLQPNPNYFDSFPTKMFEYMALRVPVVVSNFPLYERTVNEARCGLTVNPENPFEVAKSIRYLLEHPEEAAQMGENGRAAVEAKYNWSREETKLLGLYRELTAP